MHKPTLKLLSLALLFLFTAELKVLAALEDNLTLCLASGALKSKYDLLRRLGFLVEHRLGLTTITTLLAIITTLTLGMDRVFALLVLRHLVHSVLFALHAMSTT